MSIAKIHLSEITEVFLDTCVLISVFATKNSVVCSLLTCLGGVMNNISRSVILLDGNIN